jgi:hypothetical protein
MARRCRASALLLLALLAGAAAGAAGARQDRPLYFQSAHRPLTAPIRWGQAVCMRERYMMVQMFLAGASFAAISKMPFIGRNRKTVAAAVRRALLEGSLLPRPTGGRANAPPRLGPAALLYLRVRARRAGAAARCGAR